MKRRTAGELMNAEILSVPVDLSVAELAAFLAEKQVTGAPVRDAAGHLVGVVSLMDLAENQASRAAIVQEQGRPERDVKGWEDKMDPEDARALSLESEDLTVGDIMTPTRYTVPEDTPVSEVARTMVAGRIHRLLVTRGGHVVGIVTTMDLLKLLYAGEAASAG